jgi:hypothetical protein
VIGLAVITDTGLARATSTEAPLLANVPIKIFGIVFLVIMAGLIAWLIYMRRDK